MFRPDNAILSLASLGTDEDKKVVQYIAYLEEKCATQDQLAELPATGYATVLDLLAAGIEEAEAQAEFFEVIGKLHFRDAYRLDATYMRITAGFLEYMHKFGDSDEIQDGDAP